MYDELVYIIRGIAFDIYNNTVCKWPEEAFESMMFDSLIRKGLRVERQREFEVYYKGNRIGLYRTDLTVEDKVIIELKVVPETFPLYQAQTISYLKVTGFPMAVLINFGGEKIYIRAFPNKLKSQELKLQELFVNKNDDALVENSFRKQLKIDFDANKLNLSHPDRILITPYLEISREILEILGPGYFHQVYRRAYWDELCNNNIIFEWINKMELEYHGKVYGQRDLKFYKINDLLVAVLAINNFNDIILKRFSSYVKYYGCQRGLIINFNNTKLDFRYLR
ncbi:MAG: GxxExxY protein [Candidatus Falkowbacteria bacterium]